MKFGTKKKFLSLLLSLAMVISLATGLSTQVQAADKDIVVLFTNDTHCAVDDNIGHAGLALLKKEMQVHTPYVALIDAGDSIQGAPIGTLSNGEYLTDIMNQVGYDFAVPGNHEFDYGMDRFKQLAKRLNCGYYSCNFLELATGKPVLPAYKIMDFGGTKIAFVGVSTPESFTKSTPTYFQDKAGNYIYTFCEDATGERLYQQVQASVISARAEGAQYVVLVGHLGMDGSTSRWNSENLLKHISGVDICIDGHSHELYKTTVKDKDGKDVVLAQTGSKLNDIGVIIFGTDGKFKVGFSDEVPSIPGVCTYVSVKGDTASKIAKKAYGTADLGSVVYAYNAANITEKGVIPVGTTICLPFNGVTEDGKAYDLATDLFVKNIQAKFDKTLKKVIGKTDVALTTKNPVTGERAVRNAETNLGDLCADAYRLVLGADIGLSNGGGIRADIAQGNITYNDTLKVFPYGNMGCVVEATGQQIKDALEMASRNTPGENGGFLQVSGLTYTIDTSVPTTVVTDDKGNFVKVAGKYRVSDIMVAGVPLDLTRTYTVASHNYMLKSAGDGMTMFQGCNILKDEVLTDVDLLSQYISDNLGGKVGAEYATPTGQGRILVK